MTMHVCSRAYLTSIYFLWCSDWLNRWTLGNWQLNNTESSYPRTKYIFHLLRNLNSAQFPSRDSLIGLTDSYPEHPCLVFGQRLKGTTVQLSVVSFSAQLPPLCCSAPWIPTAATALNWSSFLPPNRTAAPTLTILCGLESWAKCFPPSKDHIPYRMLLIFLYFNNCLRKEGQPNTFSVMTGIEKSSILLFLVFKCEWIVKDHHIYEGSFLD